MPGQQFFPTSTQPDDNAIHLSAKPKLSAIPHFLGSLIVEPMSNLSFLFGGQPDISPDHP